MASSDFFWARNLIRGLGKMWFPLCLQEATGTGGGQSLLGSVVEELHGGFLGLEHYPAPYHMAEPGLILNALAAGRSNLKLPPALTLQANLTVPQQKLNITKKGSLKTGVGPFPSLPATFALDVDYSLMRSVTISFGATAQIEYIPTDFLGRLYVSVKGDATKINKSLAIRVDDNYIVDQVLVAKLDYLASLPVPQGKITFGFDQKQSKRVVVEVKKGPSYLVAFKVVDWDDLG